MASVLKVNEIQHSGGTTALTIDSSGRIVQPAKPAFRAYKNSSQSVTQNTWTKLEANTETFDIGGNYDTSNYRFIAPVDGIYFFHGQWFGSVNAGRGVAALYKNGSQTGETTQTLVVPTTTNGGMTYTTTGLLQLVATDYIEFYMYQEGNAATTLNNNQYLTHWFGYLVS